MSKLLTLAVTLHEAFNAKFYVEGDVRSEPLVSAEIIEGVFFDDTYIGTCLLADHELTTEEQFDLELVDCTHAVKITEGKILLSDGTKRDGGVYYLPIRDAKFHVERLARLKELKAPEIILWNEQRTLEITDLARTMLEETK